jgi:hypothetical protein
MPHPTHMQADLLGDDQALAAPQAQAVPEVPMSPPAPSPAVPVQDPSPMHDVPPPGTGDPDPASNDPQALQGAMQGDAGDENASAFIGRRNMPQSSLGG